MANLRILCRPVTNIKALISSALTPRQCNRLCVSMQANSCAISLLQEEGADVVTSDQRVAMIWTVFPAQHLKNFRAQCRWTVLTVMLQSRHKPLPTQQMLSIVHKRKGELSMHGRETQTFVAAIMAPERALRITKVMLPMTSSPGRNDGCLRPALADQIFNAQNPMKP